MAVKKCVKRGNTFYFYNEKDNSVSMFTESVCDVNKCPDNVLSAFINYDYDLEIIINRKYEGFANNLSDDELKMIADEIKKRKIKC